MIYFYNSVTGETTGPLTQEHLDECIATAVVLLGEYEFTTEEVLEDFFLRTLNIETITGHPYDGE